MEAAEKNLMLGLLLVEPCIKKSANNLCLAMYYLEPLITDFFNECYVMTDDKAVRNNRLALLQRIRRLSDGICDMRKLEGF